MYHNIQILYRMEVNTDQGSLVKSDDPTRSPFWRINRKSADKGDLREENQHSSWTIFWIEFSQYYKILHISYHKCLYIIFMLHIQQLFNKYWFQQSFPYKESDPLNFCFMLHTNLSAGGIKKRKKLNKICCMPSNFLHVYKTCSPTKVIV